MNRLGKRCGSIFRLVLSELKNLLKSLYAIVKIALMHGKLKGANVEIGSISPRKNFYTLDINRHADFPFDLRIGLPFPSGSIGFIYAEHVLEHFSYDELMNILREVYRVLMTGGRFSLVVPDVRPLLRAYSATEEEFSRSVTYDYPEALKARLDIINYLLYMEGAHKNAFDVDNMMWAIKQSGFSDVNEREFDPALDREERRRNSLYMECIKK